MALPTDYETNDPDPADAVNLTNTTVNTTITNLFRDPPGTEAVLPRLLLNSTSNTEPNTLHLTYFTGRSTQHVDEVMIDIHNIANTDDEDFPIVVSRIGIWSANPATGALTALLASSVNNVEAFTETGDKIIPLSGAAFDEVAGDFYAIGLLVANEDDETGHIASPELSGFYLDAWDDDALVAPIIYAKRGPVFDLPATVAANELESADSAPQFYLVTP